MRFLVYALGIQIYHALIFIAQPFSLKARQFVRGRRNQYQRIENHLHVWGSRPIIWIHAASYGEFEMARPIIDGIKSSNPNVKFIVSFHSPSGFEQVTLDDQDFLKIYLPKDQYSIQRRYIKLIKPKSVLIIKYEFWFNFLKALYHESIPYYFSSLHLNKDSYLFKWWMQPFEKYIQLAQGIYAHNSKSKAILKSRGYSNVYIFGDSRIEQVLQNNTKGIVLDWKRNKPCIVFGSIITGEEKIVIKWINAHPEFNYIIAPHDIDDDTLSRYKHQLSEVQLYSEIKSGHQSAQNVVLVDTMGELKYLYCNAQVSYVGGGFDKGPHNVLEPLVFTSKVICGPNIKKFPMAQYLKSLNLINIIDNQGDMGQHLKLRMQDDQAQFEAEVKLFFEENKTNLASLINRLL